MLHAYPDLLTGLRGSSGIEDFLDRKVRAALASLPAREFRTLSPGELEKACFARLKASLPASRYRYLHDTLSVEFPQEYEKLQRSGDTVFALLEILKESQSLFRDLKYGKPGEDARGIRYGIIESIRNGLC